MICSVCSNTDMKSGIIGAILRRYIFLGSVDDKREEEGETKDCCDSNGHYISAKKNPVAI